MSDIHDETSSSQPDGVPFKAETRKLLGILINSLYTERDIFLRELLSNASDALTRLDFEMLTDRNVLDPDAELSIRIIPDKEKQTLTITDTGIGMTQPELVENLGTIAHSGAEAFIQAAQSGSNHLSDMIGQFGVGFYSAFMVADWIRVTSRSYKPDGQAAVWYSTGADRYTVGPAEKETRGTTVELHLRSDATEFLEENRLRDIIRKHSDFIPFPIYIGDSQEQVNRQTAIWRQSPRSVEEKDYFEFYKQLTLDFEAPLTYTHMTVDAPVQMYAVLFIPGTSDRGLFSPRKEEGLKLYSRKVLIQEYSKDLLPEYLRFVQGVVDSEDLPLNVSRETVQSNKIMAQLKKLITAKVLDMLRALAKDKPEEYQKFWVAFGNYIKQGISTEQTDYEALYPLLRFHTTANPETWSSLDDVVERMKPGQTELYYILGEDERSLIYSPHLDLFRKWNIEVIYLTDPLDSFMLLRLNKYQDHDLKNVAAADVHLPSEEPIEGETPAETKPSETLEPVIARFKKQLGDRVSEVRTTDRLSDSPARLVDAEGSLNPEMQRVYKIINRDFKAPQKILEINPAHPLIERFGSLPEDDPLGPMIVEQIYEDALLIEGLHPDPASMISRIQKLMEAALK